MDARTVLRGIGKTLIASGTLILLFVAYQLWGTGIAEARSQDALRKNLGGIGAGPLAPPSTASPLSTTTTADPLPPPPTGDALAILRIPSIGVDKAIVQGVGVDDLKKGPGHYPDSPLPGQPGNTAIAGHRTTYGAPFYHLDEVKPGEPIYISTRSGTFEYRVVSERDVSPSEVSVIAPTIDNRLTLTTCTPRFSASQRLILVAGLVGTPTAPPTRPPPPEVAAVPRVGLSGKRQPAGPAIIWVGVCALIWIAAFILGRRWKRWPAYLLTAPVFLVALYFFFENFSRFVPANI